MRTRKGILTTSVVAITMVLAIPDARLGADSFGWSVNTWAEGIVRYRFAGSLDKDRKGKLAVLMDAATKTRVRGQMAIWQNALKVPDPAAPTRVRYYIRFEECSACGPTEPHVLFRMNGPDETNNMCSYHSGGKEHVGRNPSAENAVTVFHMEANDGLGAMVPGSTRGTDDLNTIRHELGHCLGLWHEQNRLDRDAWLKEDPEADSGADWLTLFDPKIPQRTPDLMPMLGNYDYDSIMHYGSEDDNRHIRWTDPNDKTFDRTYLPAVSRHDVSRVLQYYARQAQPNWGFFESLATPPVDSDVPASPALAPAPTPTGNPVWPRGTPAIAYQSGGNYDIFSRGTNNCIYWKSVRRVWGGFDPGEAVSGWTSIGCHLASEPAAISLAPGQVDVIAIDDSTAGRPKRARLQDGVWSAWSSVGGTLPEHVRTGVGGGKIGAAVTSRSAGQLDVFVVLASGDLAVSTFTSFGWGNWIVLDTSATISARPAALAASATSVRLAVNANDTELYEPLVRFPPETGVVQISLGSRQATMAGRTPPALAARADAGAPYRVLIVTTQGRVAHKFRGGGWWDIGGIPEGGVAAVGTGALGAIILMNGAFVGGCTLTCDDGYASGFLQLGGLWIRQFR